MAAALSLPELQFLSPLLSTPKRRLSLSRNPRFRSTKIIRTCRIKASKEDRPAAVIERVNGLELKPTNGAAVSSENGNGEAVYGGNGSLVKYVNANGNGAAVKAEVVEVVGEEAKEEGRKKRVEEIGKEDAWFKRKGNEQVEVSVRLC